MSSYIALTNNAVTVHYHYGERKGEFTVWLTTRNTYQWSALGNGGEEKTQEKAIDSARDWIINSFNKGE